MFPFRRPLVGEALFMSRDFVLLLLYFLYWDVVMLLQGMKHVRTFHHLREKNSHPPSRVNSALA